MQPLLLTALASWAAKKAIRDDRALNSASGADGMSESHGLFHTRLQVGPATYDATDASTVKIDTRCMVSGLPPVSRLDSFIRRMSAQRDILNELTSRIDGITGAIFEFGLGSGRTYDHLREIFPDRRIIVFESVVKDLPLERVAKDDLLIGDLRQTTSPMPDGCAAFIHTDIETGVPERDAELAAWLPRLVARLLVPGGFAASSSNLLDPRLSPCPLPKGIQVDRYHVVRRI